MKDITFSAVFILILFFTVISDAFDEGSFKTLGIQRLNQEAPYFTVVDSNGKKIGINEYRGKVVILHFWATWCKPCRKEFPLFEKLYQNFKGRGVVFLPVSIDRKANREDVEKTAREFGLSSPPIYMAVEGDVTDKYWTWGIPVTYFLDKKGWITGRVLGPRDWASDSSNKFISSMVEDR
ncbi:MAG: hypothetical protein A3I04_05805 [Nitrospinae bacterium RIFCSPLOWO2_02_FULL_39_110]|nr:MAG: hypothetical protein A3D20_02980 [Nitrospinae bacterium RIFCSPHIGHO2_02_FULL_39_82]OGW00355.1 MAG: hypothetical protein A3D97_05195 [Nitrospinae bacterium RIFCSPHIGHO2_12_FULL_39_42]OGW03847.1 MAG: hypothetical protein A3I04_05805 [Nitrospinae bacterium RIFCSPLOWO2_02_FULL_39_110]OGW05200.1 MAG: hypothetical protein A2Z59_06045 [Nitrospinae bacterium RIFCSPLOWO2_02_39_17]OGW08007.1 MAG: hypothetical protein A2W75_03950 [Nitrospinae bacterium RIFCSPLOWO2_12_39_15]OGW09015.1 MAG: hypothe